MLHKRIYSIRKLEEMVKKYPKAVVFDLDYTLWRK